MTTRLEDDFESYVNAEWKNQNSIPDKYPAYDNFLVLNEKMEKEMIEICKNKKNKLLNQTFTLFLSQKENHFANHIKPKIKIIESIKRKDKLLDFVFNEILKGNYYLLHIYFDATCRNPKFNIPHFVFDGISLPDKTHYENDKLKPEFEKMLSNIFTLLNLSTKQIKDIWNIENLLSKKHYSQTEMRDPLKTYNPATLYQFVDISKKEKINYNSLLKILPSEFHDITVNNIELAKEILSAFEKFNLASLKTWIIWHVISSQITSSSGKFYELYFNFFKKKLNGIKEEKQLEERAYIFTKNYFGDEFNKIYLKEKVDKKLHERFPVFMKKIKLAVEEKLNSFQWLSVKTKLLALDKLNSMNMKCIGPSVLQDYSFFEKKHYSTIYELIDDYRKWDWEELEINQKMYKTSNPHKWEMDAVDINAYYHPFHNEIVFPAAILQAPFYDPNASHGQNAGAIGAIIAHEMTHGFDDNGSMYDKNGYFSFWWSPKDREEYVSLIKPLETYFDNLKYNNQSLNGKLTLGENLADLGGLQCALHSCTTDKDKKECMIAWARNWRSLMRDEYAKQNLIIDVHSLPQFRVNGILPHIDDFYRLFHIKETDRMFLPIAKRCRLYS
jgi:putative endopeptidase